MANTKYPFMVEFTGSPEAGKTTTIKSLYERLTNEFGLKVQYIQESAEIVKDMVIPNGCFEAHLTMRLLTLINIIKSKHYNYDLILIDRGIIDGIFYTIKYMTDHPEESLKCSNLIEFLKFSRTHLDPDLLIIFSVDPKVAIERKGHEGKLVNLKYVNDYNQLLTKFKEHLNDILYTSIDTTYLDPNDVTKKICDIILKTFEENQRN